MSRISSSLAKLNDYLENLVKRQEFVIKKKHYGMTPEELDLHATLMGGKFIPPKLYDPTRKTPKESVVKSASERKISERERHRQESLNFIRDYYSGAIGAVPNVPVGVFKGFAGDMPLFKLKWRMQSMMASAAKYVAGMYMPSELPS